MKGRIVVIEGLDGAGKSTQIKLLREFFNKSQIKHEFLHFPTTNTSLGDLISRYLRGELGEIEEINPYFAALMYADDRKCFLPTLAGWLEQNDIVLLDRYIHSNLAYNAAKLKDEQEKHNLVQWILNLEYQEYKLPKPALTVFIDMPLGFIKSNLHKQRSGCDRAYLNGKSDIHEKDFFFQGCVREEYLKLAQIDSNFIILNPPLKATPKQISALVIDTIKKHQVI